MSNEQNSSNKLSAIPGLAVCGCFVVGLIGIILAFVSSQPGICLLASAVAFGVVVHASFRR
jgi:hypothetical protein